MPLSQSQRIAAVQAPVIPVVSRWIAETPGTISLGQGVVSYGPPAEVVEAAQRASARAANHGYGPIEGEPELLAAIERKLEVDNAIVVEPGSHLYVTAGCNLAFMHAMLAIVDTGDEVILPLPYYFNHEMAVEMAGGRAVPVRTTASFQLDIEAIATAITPRTRAVVTVSPNNPTGVVYAEASLRALNALCAARGLFHVSDETYEYFTYGQVAHFSAGAIPGAAAHTISLYSLSKAFGMAGWRVGYMIVPDVLSDGLAKIQDTLLICATVVAQHAAVAALGVGRAHAARHLPDLERTRRRMLGALTAPGLPCDVVAPDGAFYFFLKVRTPLGAMTLTERLIREHGVAVTPGSAFGHHEGCSVRVSYGALDPETVAEGLGRLVTGLAALAGVLALWVAGWWS
ncbi:MAG: pyridoxal phosphate-dependent aminotransferase [Acidobacteriota bacterium]